ncbi:MAG: DUF2142 domain-containing protein [Christensenellaceae bacterium]
MDMQTLKNKAGGILPQKNLKQRLILIAIFVVLIIAYVFIFIPRTSFEYLDNGGTLIRTPEITSTAGISQEITANGGQIKGIGIVFDTHNRKNIAEYHIDLVNSKGETVVSNVFNADKVQNGEVYTVPVPQVQTTAGEKFSVKLYSAEAAGGNALSAYVVDTGGTQANATMADKPLDGSIRMSVGYFHISHNIWLITAILILAVALAILFWSDQLHNNVLILLLVFGTLMCFLTPIFDVPDEPEHFARTFMMTNGDFFRSDAQGNLISTSFKDLHDANLRATLATTNLHGVPISTDMVYELTGSGQFFLWYLPQAWGMFVARLLNFGILPAFYMGRLFNLFFYAAMAWIAIKKAPKFKLFLAVAALMPMSLFVASSYNSDGMLYGLMLVLISYFIKMYFDTDKKLSYKQVLFFTLFCALISMKKYSLLPLCLLPMFIPAARYESRKKKWLGLLMTVGIVTAATISIFMLTAAIDMQFASAANSSLSPNGENLQGANMFKQLSFMLHNPSTGASVIVKTGTLTAGDNLEQMFTFGWMSYGLDTIFIYIYFAFMALVAFAYTKYEYQKPLQTTSVSTANRLGILLVMLAVFLLTYLSLYLGWTPVGLGTVLGVQGRYLIPILLLLPFLAQNVSPLVSKDAYDRSQYNIVFVAVLFLSLSVLSTVLHYY